MLDFLDAEEVSISFVSNFDLKKYYEIVDDARPLSGFFPLHADFCQSDPSSNCFTIDV